MITYRYHFQTVESWNRNLRPELANELDEMGALGYRLAQPIEFSNYLTTDSGQDRRRYTARIVMELAEEKDLIETLIESGSMSFETPAIYADALAERSAQELAPVSNELADDEYNPARFDGWMNEARRLGI